MKFITKYLQSFGFDSTSDYLQSTLPLKHHTLEIVAASSILGLFRLFCHDIIGMDLAVFIGFVALVCAEFYTGVKLDRVKRQNKFQSRKAGRMFLKVGTYIFILSILKTFAAGVQVPELAGYDLNPFEFLYYTVFIGIVFQLVISWLENLAGLGYKETNTILGFIIKKFNRWFELDGEKITRHENKD